MGYKRKTPKGEVSIDNHAGRIRLRWRYAGERYSLNLPYAYLPENLHPATVKVTEIKLDIMKGCFDPSLEKYRVSPIAKPIASKAMVNPGIVEQPKSQLFLHDLVSKFNYWGKNIRNVDVDNSIDYLYTQRLLEKWVNVPVDQLAQKLNGENWVATTYNRRLTYLTTFFSWLLSIAEVERNPLQDVCRKRSKGKKKNPRRKPLEEQEIHSFLNTIKNDTYCHPSSTVKHSYYYPFLVFIFSTGVRNAEAIGLRVRHVDFANKLVEISEAFARTVKGTNHAARIQKGTKMENVRYLPLTDELVILLERQVISKQPNDFIFPSPKGLCIDDRMLERRILKPILIKLGFGDRDLYSARHAFGTRAVQQGMPLTDLAYLMGHSTIETASRNYVHVGKPAVALPVINKNTTLNFNTMYKEDIIKHYIQNWKNQPEVFIWKKGPIEKLPANFRVLVFAPTAERSMWTYATCCMSQSINENPVELHLFSSKEDAGIVELLAALTYYHNNTSEVNLHHTVNFGRGWQDNSPCSYGFISLPYLDGPNLENLIIQNRVVKFYWLIPVTKEEVDYKVSYGVEALEEKFDNGFNYLNPQRKIVIS